MVILVSRLGTHTATTLKPFDRRCYVLIVLTSILAKSYFGLPSWCVNDVDWPTGHVSSCGPSIRRMHMYILPVY